MVEMVDTMVSKAIALQRAGSTPAVGTYARLVKQVATQDLKSCPHREGVGSNPTSGTKI